MRKMRKMFQVVATGLYRLHRVNSMDRWIVPLRSETQWDDKP